MAIVSLPRTESFRRWYPCFISFENEVHCRCPCHCDCHGIGEGRTAGCQSSSSGPLLSSRK